MGDTDLGTFLGRLGKTQDLPTPAKYQIVAVAEVRMVSVYRKSGDGRHALGQFCGVLGQSKLRKRVPVVGRCSRMGLCSSGPRHSSIDLVCRWPVERIITVCASNEHHAWLRRGRHLWFEKRREQRWGDNVNRHRVNHPIRSDSALALQWI